MVQRPEHVLVVDDDQLLIRALSRHTDRPRHLVVATTGAAALALADEHLLELAIIDFYLGAERGSDLVRELRLRHPTLHIVMLSGAFTSDAGFAARDAGADAIVHKPATWGDLLAARQPAAILTLDQMEIEHARRVLALMGGNRRKTARALSISPARLYRLLPR